MALLKDIDERREIKENLKKAIECFDFKQKFAKIKSAAIINSELSLDDRTLTPSMKVAPKNVLEKYKAHLKNMYGENVPTEEEVYIVELDVKNNIARKIVHD